MRSITGRPGDSTIWRRLAMAALGIPICGCAAMTQDVDAYYRQMAVNYQEAIDDAKKEESALDKKLRLSAGSYRPQPLTSAMPPAMLLRHPSGVLKNACLEIKSMPNHIVLARIPTARRSRTCRY